MDQDEKLRFLAESIANAKKVMDKVDANTSSMRPKTNPDQVQRKQVRESAPQRKANNMMHNINKSKMPKEILESFMENPIADPTVYGVENLVQEANKHLAPINERFNNLNEEPVINNSSAQMDTRLIEYIIKKTVEETIEQIQKKTSVDENFQIKIGNKVFSGKLSTLTENKKPKN